MTEWKPVEETLSCLLFAPARSDEMPPAISLPIRKVRLPVRSLKLHGTPMQNGERGSEYCQ